jgi:hypothetical protein
MVDFRQIVMNPPAGMRVPASQAVLATLPDMLVPPFIRAGLPKIAPDNLNGASGDNNADTYPVEADHPPLMGKNHAVAENKGRGCRDVDHRRYADEHPGPHLGRVVHRQHDGYRHPKTSGNRKPRIQQLLRRPAGHRVDRDQHRHDEKNIEADEYGPLPLKPDDVVVLVWQCSPHPDFADPGLVFYSEANRDQPNANVLPRSAPELAGAESPVRHISDQSLQEEPEMLKTSIVAALLCTLCTSGSLFAAQVEGHPPELSLPSNSCFGPPDYCSKQFANTHDKEYYDLCMLSERVCRSYKYNALMMRLAILPWDQHEGVPVFSVGDLLSMCKSDADWQKDTCRENVVAWTSRAGRRGRRWRSVQEWEKNYFPIACTTRLSISDREFIKAFVEWGEKHPSQANLDVRRGLVSAIAASWPCPGRTPVRGH